MERREGERERSQKWKKHFAETTKSSLNMDSIDALKYFCYFTLRIEVVSFKPIKILEMLSSDPSGQNDPGRGKWSHYHLSHLAPALIKKIKSTSHRLKVHSLILSSFRGGVQIYLYFLMIL